LTVSRVAVSAGFVPIVTVPFAICIVFVACGAKKMMLLLE